ncbi:MAG: cytochrome-c peroxidase [Rhizobiales bacterium]|nr:cytochrome-c peroxidase [Hyphomicrobiales bacterium]
MLGSLLGASALALVTALLTDTVVAQKKKTTKSDPAAAQTTTAVAVKFPPLGPLPPVPVPADNPMSPAKVELGKKLFFDPRMGGDASSPCAACHLPEQGWGDGGEISRGYPGTQHWRNSQTVLNSAYYNKLFWEGNVTSLEAQAPSAAEGNVAGNGDPSLMEMRLRFIPEYVAEFKKVFGTEWPRITQAYQAIAAFERTIVSDAKKVPFDRYMMGDKPALSADALRGFELFKGKAGCIQCHNGPLASDQRFYSLGVPENELFKTDPLYQITHRWEHYQKGITATGYKDADLDMGLYYQTKNPKDIGKFRTPSLRELKYTAPYMHNGILYTLEEVVDFYNVGGGPGPNKSPLVKPLGLNDQEKKELVAFLNSLSMDTPMIVKQPTLPEYQVMK